LLDDGDKNEVTKTKVNDGDKNDMEKYLRGK
jgi:hypothetical protein